MVGDSLDNQFAPSGHLAILDFHTEPEVSLSSPLSVVVDVPVAPSSITALPDAAAPVAAVAVAARVATTTSATAIVTLALESPASVVSITDAIDHLFAEIRGTSFSCQPICLPWLLVGLMLHSSCAAQRGYKPTASTFRIFSRAVCIWQTWRTTLPATSPMPNILPPGPLRAVACSAPAPRRCPAPAPAPQPQSTAWSPLKSWRRHSPAMCCTFSRTAPGRPPTLARTIRTHCATGISPLPCVMFLFPLVCVRLVRYAQCNQVCGFLFCAGMLGLHPATMRLPSPDAFVQLTHAVDNCRAVLSCMGSDHTRVVAAVVFVATGADAQDSDVNAAGSSSTEATRLEAMHAAMAENVARVRRLPPSAPAVADALCEDADEDQDEDEDEEALNSPPLPVMVVAVPALPRAAAVEIQLLAWQSRLGAALPVTFSPPVSQAISAESGQAAGRLLSETAAVWQSLCSVQMSVIPSPDAELSPDGASVRALLSAAVASLDHERTLADLPWSSAAVARVYFVPTSGIDVTTLRQMLTATWHAQCAAATAADRSQPPSGPASIPSSSSSSSSWEPAWSLVPVCALRHAAVLTLHVVWLDCAQQQTQQWIRDVRGPERVG